MAWAHVSTTPQNTASGATSLTKAHALGSGSDRIILVGLTIEGSDVAPSSVTFDGVAMVNDVTATGNGNAQVWRLGEGSLPSGGSSYNCVVSGVNGSILLSINEYTGVADQAAEATNTDVSPGGSTYNFSVTTVTADALVFVAAGIDSPFTHTQGSAYTERSDQTEIGGVDTGGAVQDRTGPTTPGSTTVDGSWSGSKRHATAVAVYEIATGGGGTTVSPGSVSHSYSGQVNKVSAAVGAGAVSQTYSMLAVQARASVLSGVAVHTFTGIAPQVRGSVITGITSHTYNGVVPSVLSGFSVGAPEVTHAYSAVTPQVRTSVFAAVMNHTYAGVVPTISSGNSVVAITAAHTYLGVVPAVPVTVQSGVASHTFAGIVPQAQLEVAVPVGDHSYNGVVSKINASVMPTFAVHSYTANGVNIGTGAAPTGGGPVFYSFNWI